MKKILLATILMAGATAAQAQDNAIKVNIFSPIVKTGSFFFEHKLSASSSLQLGASFTKTSADDADLSGFAITPEYRLYLSSSKEALEGFYVGPYLRYRHLKLMDTSDNGTGSPMAEASLNTFGGGVLIGRQWIFKQRFSLDTFLGPSYGAGSLKYEENDGTRRDFSDNNFLLGIGFGIRTGVTFGLAF
ncbi:DUF3575 domain-containing protein [uncultured Hymenobacter sp.]|uniref:DUF3575 domain-containing protein n=1 Tax=uncultured Hymenobacter sp. TaxID=170016 RepID=UPI0035CA6FC9